MKTKIRSFRNRQLKLVIDEPGMASKDCAVLAVAELYEGLGVWTISDVRLKEHAQVSPYFCVGADDYWASWTAPDKITANRASMLVKERFPSDDDGLTLSWCTFDGLVRGKTPAEMGVAKHLQNPSPLLHTRKQVLDELKSMTEFWAQWPGHEADKDIRAKASKVKIANPWRQVRNVGLAIRLQDIQAAQDQKGEMMSDVNSNQTVSDAGWTIDSVVEVLSRGGMLTPFNQAYMKIYVRRPPLPLSKDAMNRFFQEGAPEFNPPGLVPMLVAQEALALHRDGSSEASAASPSPSETQVQPLQKNEWASAITMQLRAHGWTEFVGGPALATKMFETAVGPRQASVMLVDYGLNSSSFVLAGHYESEGRNCLEPHEVLIPKTADLSEIMRVTARFSENVDAVVSQTYAARLLNLQSEQNGEAEPAPVP